MERVLRKAGLAGESENNNDEEEKEKTDLHRGWEAEGDAGGRAAAAGLAEVWSPTWCCWTRWRIPLEEMPG